MKLSTNAKEAIKIALAMTLAYYVAMRFDWFSPSWAAISVAFISLPTAGQSLNKGMLRLGGTLLAFVVGLFYLGLFPQDRWLFLISFTPYLAVVSYMVTGKNGQYFWFVAGFVSMMITTAGVSSSEHAFEFAAFRTLETLVGILIWTLISVFIWPRTNRATLTDVSRKLLATQRELLSGYGDRLAGHGTDETLQPALSRQAKLVAQLGQTIGAAASESYEVREVRTLWERLHGLSESTLETLARLLPGLEESRQIAIGRALPELGALFSEMSSRLEEAGNILCGKSPARPCKPIELSIDDAYVRALEPFQRAAVEVTRNELESLDAQTRAMLDCVLDLEGYDAEPTSAAAIDKSREAAGPLGLPPLDPERVRGAIMVVASMWAGALIWIYWNPPGHASWYQFLPNITLAAVQSMHTKPGFLKPFAFAYVVGMGVYVFIMPELSVFWQIGLVIFALSFAAAYFFPGIGRVALFLAMFNMLGISNQQTYDFAAMANAFLFTMLALIMVVLLSYITRSPRQEKAFLSMVSRFFRSCEFLVSRVAEPADHESPLEKMRRAFHRRELLSLPEKLQTWGSQIDRKRFPHNTPDRIEGIVTGTRTLAYRIEELIRARGAPQASILVRELRDDVRSWRIVIEQGLKNWSERPETESVAELRERLSARLAKLNARIAETLNSAGEGQVSDQESRSFYRLLGSYRGLSEAAVAYAGSAAEIDWAEWREERF